MIVFAVMGLALANASAQGPAQGPLNVLTVNRNRFYIHSIRIINQSKCTRLVFTKDTIIIKIAIIKIKITNIKITKDSTFNL